MTLLCLKKNLEWQIRFCINLSVYEIYYYHMILTLVKVQSQAVFLVTEYFNCFNKLSYHWYKVEERNAATQQGQNPMELCETHLLCSASIHCRKQWIRTIIFYGPHYAGKLQVSNHAASLHYYNQNLQIYMLWMSWLSWLPLICNHCFYNRDDWFMKDSITI